MSAARAQDRPPIGVLLAYVGAVVVLAIGVVVLAWFLVGVEPLADRWLALAILFAVLCWSEARPIPVVRRDGVDGVVASTTFGFALFLTFGVVPALVGQALASIIGDVAGRKPLVKLVFNAGQYVLAWGAAGVGFALVAGAPPADVGIESFTGTWYAAVVVAGLVYFAVNNALVGIALGLSQGVGPVTSIRSTLTSEWGTDLLLLALAPIVVAVVERSIVLLPVLLLPVLAVYRSVVVSAEKQHLALHDPLTDLPNRFNVTTVLDGLVDRADERVGPAVVLFDLDHFREVNDTLGHQAGDALLRMIGPRIAEVVPDGGLVGRLGGDEFVVLVPRVTDPAVALEVAHAIAGALQAPFHVAGVNIEVTGSIGVAVHPVDGRDAEELVKSADIAMYRAKARRSVVERYAPEIDPHSTRRLALLGEMRSAIADGRIVLRYQPKLDLATGRITECETLIRWEHPEHGSIEPSEFVPLAEHTGLISPLTSHVVEQAARQVAAWCDAGLELVAAVNLSARSLLDATLVEEVAGVLRAAGVPARLLRFEITEGAIMVDPDRARAILGELAAMGVRLSVDDFGTGHSSLAYLKDLPVDELKIDRSFVTGLLESPGEQVIVRSIIDLGHHLGLTTVAEGVEDATVLDWLAAAGCDQAQGYHVGHPMGADELVLRVTSEDD